MIPVKCRATSDSLHEARRILLEAIEKPVYKQTRIPAAAASLQAVRQDRVGEQRRFQPRSNTGEYSPENFGYFAKKGGPPLFFGRPWH